MVRKKTAAGKGRRRKLKVKKETLRDLDAKPAGKNVKGGWGPILPTYGCKTADCPVGGTAGTVCGILIG